MTCVVSRHPRRGAPAQSQQGCPWSPLSALEAQGLVCRPKCQCPGHSLPRLLAYDALMRFRQGSPGRRLAGRLGDVGNYRPGSCRPGGLSQLLPDQPLGTGVNRAPSKSTSARNSECDLVWE